MDESSESGWVGYHGDRHGRPAPVGNDHLTSEQQELLQRQGEERARARGRHQVTVVVDVYENGEAAPQVQFPRESTIDIWDRAQVNACVAKAAEALANWR